MNLRLVAFRRTKGGDVTEVWFANNNAAQVYHNSLRGIVADLKLEKVSVPVANRNALATWLNNRYTYSTVPVLLDDKVLEAHINAKTAHLVVANPTTQTNRNK